MNNRNNPALRVQWTSHQLLLVDVDGLVVAARGGSGRDFISGRGGESSLSFFSSEWYCEEKSLLLGFPLECEWLSFILLVAFCLTFSLYCWKTDALCTLHCLKPQWEYSSSRLNEWSNESNEAIFNPMFCPLNGEYAFNHAYINRHFRISYNIYLFIYVYKLISRNEHYTRGAPSWRKPIS